MKLKKRKTSSRKVTEHLTEHVADPHFAFRAVGSLRHRVFRYLDTLTVEAARRTTELSGDWWAEAREGIGPRTVAEPGAGNALAFRASLFSENTDKQMRVC